ncbi:WGR domain-containing protein [Donghicola sp.]|jgi:predicted DNA-binding WGR domain protein|uniref:WGR domain-containing protein n=1 Tax=Donghicola sp. TaxID=1929294 RepID=UPI0025E1762F|nr:WGR domain-containing protein [Donghicola sp.]MCT4575718.1 WGR domain-containing protein [Donghicola sp.]
MRVDLARTDPDVNMNRFYYVQLTKGIFGDAGVERFWGRRGTSGRHRLDWYQSEMDASSAMTKLVKAKLKRGYAPIETREPPNNNLIGFVASLARKQNETKDN